MPDKTSTAPRRSGFRSWIRAAVHISIQAFLAALIILQVYVLWERALPVPEFALDRLHRQLEYEGLILEYESLSLLPPLRLAVNSVRVKSSTDPGISIRAESLYIDFSPALLLRREIQPRSVLLEQGLFTHAPDSNASGGNDVLARDFHLALDLYESEWRIRSLLFRSGDLAVNVRGALRELPVEPPEPIEELSWNEMLVRGAEEFSHFKSAHLDGVEDGILNIRLGSGLFDATSIDARLTASRYVHPSGIEIERPDSSIAMTLNNDNRPGSLSLRASTVRFRDQVEIQDALAELKLPSGFGAEKFLPTEITIAADHANALGEYADDLYIEGWNVDEEWADFSFFLRRDGEPVRGGANVKPGTGEGTLYALSDINPSEILDSPRVRETGFRSDVTFDDAPELLAEMEFGPNWIPRHADLELRSGPCTVDGVELEAAYAIARWTPDRELDVTTLNLNGGDFEVRGSFRTDLRSQDFRLLLQGTIRPLHIRPWFRDWWESFWNEFEFAGSPPSAEVDFRGNWNRTDDRFVSGSMEGRELRVRGVDIARVRGGYRVTENDTRIYDARIDRPEGIVEGSLHHRRGRDEYVAFDLKSGIDTTAASALIGGIGAEILDTFTFEAPPEVRLTGRVRPGGPYESISLGISARSDSPLTFNGLPLDHLALDGLLAESTLTLDPIEIGFSDGEARASASIDFENEETPLEISLSMKDVSFGKAIEQLTRTFGGGDVSDSAYEEILNLGGKADFEMTAEGLLDDLQSFKGSGEIQVRDADFGRVRLLGLLSRVLDQTPLRFTSLRLNEAESSFEFENGVVHFPDMQMKGPNVGMEARGDYKIDGGELDFSVKLFLLRQSPMPFVSAILGRILEPFGHILETSLTGTLEDPQWRMPLDPRRAFELLPSSPAGEP